MLEKTTRDAPLVEAMDAAAATFRAYLACAGDILMAGRLERGRSRARVRAAIGHAISFHTWQSLVREQGMAEREAVAVMAALVESAGAARLR